MKRSPSVLPFVLLGLFAAPYLLTGWCWRAVVLLVQSARALLWIRAANRDGIKCRYGHVRRISAGDQYLCPDCSGVIRGTPPWLPCPLCGGDDDAVSPTPRWIPCECGLACPVPPIPRLVIWLTTPPRSAAHTQTAADIGDDITDDIDEVEDV